MPCPPNVPPSRPGFAPVGASRRWAEGSRQGHVRQGHLCRGPARWAGVFMAAAALFSAENARAAEITVPVEVGIGPSFSIGPGPLFRGVPGHFGLEFDLAAIIDQETIRRNLHRVPKKYRAAASNMREVRYRPSMFIPDSLWISPNLYGTGMIGLTFRPIGLAIPLVDAGVRVRLQADALLSYAFIWSDHMAASITHFLRPGISVGVQMELPVTDSFSFYFGADTDFYLPQEPGRSVLAVPAFDSAGLDRSIWLMGKVWLQVAWRFPYTTRI